MWWVVFAWGCCAQPAGCGKNVTYTRVFGAELAYRVYIVWRFGARGWSGWYAWRQVSVWYYITDMGEMLVPPYRIMKMTRRFSSSFNLYMASLMYGIPRFRASRTNAMPRKAMGPV